MLLGAKTYYATRPVEFIEHWCITYDPRNAGSEVPPTLPFILFPRQRDLVTFLYACLKDEEAGLIEKCRDMGATWVCACFSVWLWLFWPGAAVGWGSRKEQLVDKIGDPDSIFEKMRAVVRMLPRELKPAGLNPSEHMTYMKFINPANGATITGEAGDNIGRGGRKGIYFKDEAQPLDAKVLTPTGWSTMGEMAVGSEVIGLDGLRHRVTHINDCGVHPVYRLGFSDGTSVECSENHLWAVNRVWGKRCKEVLRASEIAARVAYVSPVGHSQYLYRVPTAAPVRFEAGGPLPLHPYIVGALIGDGSVGGLPQNKATLTSADEEIPEQFRQLLPGDCRIVKDKGSKYHYRLNDAKGARGRFKVSRMSLAIMAAGIAGSRAHTKFIPDQYKHAAVEDRLALLQGLMDTDGSASGGVASYHTCSPTLVDDVRFVVQSLGGTATLNVKSDHRGYRDMYVLHLVLPAGMVPFRLTRKINALKPRKHPTGRTIVSAEMIGRKPVRCITVDAEDGLYLTDHCVVTHNSAWYEHPEKIEAALGDNTRVQIDISSVHGLGNVFHRRREAGTEWAPDLTMPKGRTRVFIMDWRDHPAKDQAWYDQRRAQAEANGLLHVFAQEVERNYAAAVEGVIIPAEWVSAAIDAHMALGFDESGAWRAALDVADEGGDLHALAMARGVVVKSVQAWGEGDVGSATRRAIADLEGLNVDVQYDSVGIGAGVKSEANRLAGDGILPAGIRFLPWTASASPLNPDGRVIPGDDNSPLNKDFYANLKAQGWWELRRRFERTFKARTLGETYDHADMISLPGDLPSLQTLRKELSQATRGKTGALKLVVNKTPEGTRSPNMADALMMAFWPVTPAYDVTGDWI